MSAVFPIFARIILVIEFIVGIIGNGLITAVICIDWIRSTNLTPCDMILASLAISRILLQCLIMVESFLRKDGLENCNLVFKIFVVLWIFLNSVCLWFATWLSVFYCVKIASFSQLLFLWLKQRISWLVPWLLMGSLFVSFCICIPLVCMNYTLCDPNETLSLTFQQGKKLETPILYIFMLDLLVPFIPFLIFIVSASLLITSLWRHTRRMQIQITNFQDPHTSAHVGAIKALIAFIVFYLSNWVALMSLVSSYFLPDSENVWFEKMAIAAYPSGHSVILILFNPKLKQGSLRILNPTKWHLKEEAS